MKNDKRQSERRKFEDRRIHHDANQCQHCSGIGKVLSEMIMVVPELGMFPVKQEVTICGNCMGTGRQNPHPRQGDFQ